MTDDHYTSAVEAFVGKQNGDTLTPHIVYEFVKALNADNRSRHEETMGEIAKLAVVVGGRAEAIEQAKREVLDEIERRESWPVLDKAIAEMCAKLDARSPRRATDSSDSDWTGKRPRLMAAEPSPQEDEEMGDLRRAWRFAKWFVVAFGLIFIDMFARYLSHILFGYPS